MGANRIGMGDTSIMPEPSPRVAAICVDGPLIDRYLSSALREFPIVVIVRYGHKQVRRKIGVYKFREPRRVWTYHPVKQFIFGEE